jgi:glycine/D-amino acid oxidase-like deaminating enzyme
LAYARGLAEAAIREGAIIYTQSAVRDAKPHNDGWRLQTDLGHVDARRVIVAGDIYTTGPWSILREQQIPLPYFNIATKPLPLAQRHRILPERQGAWDTCRILSSFRFDGDGRLVFGSVGALNGRGAATHRAWVARKLRQLFPEIGNVEFEHEWWGMIGMTTDNMPRFHRLADNVVAIAGYNGRGIGPGTVFGQCLAGLMTGKISEAELPLPITRPSLPRWRRTRQAFYESGARCWHMISALDSRIR